jgi:hypothetical protein
MPFLQGSHLDQHRRQARQLLGHPPGDFMQQERLAGAKVP